MFTLGDADLNDIPTSFPDGRSEHPMQVIKAEIKVPARRSEKIPADIEPFRRTLAITFEVDDENSDFFEMTAMRNVAIYIIPKTHPYADFSPEAKRKLREALNFYKTALYDLGFSEDEVNEGVTEDQLIGIKVNATVTKNDYVNVTGYKVRESVIED